MSDFRCGRCHRILKNPECIEIGFGKVCFQKMTGKPFPHHANTAISKSETKVSSVRTRKKAEPLPWLAGDVVCKRGKDGAPQTNIPHRIIRHSPDGFEWGYGGSGPSELALNILALYIGEAKADLPHQEFKRVFIATMPEEGGVIKKEAIDKWLEERGAF